mmetsp:Transcript_36402/g.108172  ORF Transcript_36402/g.108172 Transcript_36402/m.108172 type:complete len:972 (-) Transcript_36402:31-2946(-)
MSNATTGSTASDFENALNEWALDMQCSEIDLEASNNFIAVWLWALVYGSALAGIVTIPFLWCKSREKKKPDLDELPEAEKIDVPRREGDPEGEEANVPPEPNLEAARRHLLMTSAGTLPRGDGFEWRSIWRTHSSDIVTIGGPGLELYFRLLKNLGFCFVFMAAITSPMPAFSQYGNFVPDNGQNLTLTTVGNLGAVTSTGLFPGDRYVIVGCQGMALRSLTQIFGWLDFFSICTFVAFVAYFRFHALPKADIESEAATITAKEFAVEIDKLPRTIKDHGEYSRLLKEHLENRMQVLRNQSKGPKPQAPNKVCEVMLVRDYGGKLGDIKSRLELQQKLAVQNYAKQHGAKNDKKIEKMDKRLAKITDRLGKKLDEATLDVIRAYAIVNTPSDADNLINDYRFGSYSLFRCCQKQDKRFEGKALRVRKAPDPSNILWENQDCPWKWRLVRKSLIGLVCFLLILVAFVAAFALNTAAKSQTKATHLYLNHASCDPAPAAPAADAPVEEEYKCLWNATEWDMNWVRDSARPVERDCYCGVTGYAKIAMNFDVLQPICESWLIESGKGIAISAAAAAFVVVVNTGCKIILEMLAYSERPISITALNTSIITKIFATMTMNTGLVIFAVNFSPPDWLPPGISDMLKLVFRGDFSDAVRGWYGLVGGAIMMNLATNMVAPAGTNFAIMVVDMVKRRLLSGRQKHQVLLLDLYTNKEFKITARLAQVLMTVFVTMIYSAGMPILNLFAAAFMFTMYWSDKIVLLRGSHRPPAFDSLLAKQASEILLYSVPLHLLMAIWMYGQPCTFPSEPFGLMAATVSQYSGESVSGGQSYFERLSLKSTWMLSTALLGIAGLWGVWMLMWILGGTLGEGLQMMSTICCGARNKRTSPEDQAGDNQSWEGSEGAKLYIEGHCPPASYRLDKSPGFKHLAHFLKDGSNNAWKAQQTGPLADGLAAPAAAAARRMTSQTLRTSSRVSSG